ncbi:imidazole glycerol phosphate synthase subunit HisH [Synechococcus sp. UW105]|uniref:imidazole glycerol phosphate synthase subunit HisH n=1 Tax=Synechococcus sp. UW105 TaxID=337067 RepID=UPI000E0E1602|nr:imidazole glycerol phosphate synthase subunit HisH [Synechococcus sp. UW105]
MITIIDYGMGNLGSVVNMLRRVEVDCEVTCDPVRISNASSIILPGVGAFDAAMERIDDSGIRQVLDDKALHQKVPILGICLGMQLLTRGSEEGTRPGLGWIPAVTRRIPSESGIKIPHMGWNVAERTRQSKLTDHLDGEIRFYFVHSFCVKTDDPHDTVLRTRHGQDFAAAVQHSNIMGAQFHPEKSHRFGMQLLKNFAYFSC